MTEAETKDDLARRIAVLGRERDELTRRICSYTLELERLSGAPPVIHAPLDLGQLAGQVFMLLSEGITEVAELSRRTGRDGRKIIGALRTLKKKGLASQAPDRWILIPVK